MYKFGQEITPVLSGTTWPVQVAQYDRYIQEITRKTLPLSFEERIKKLKAFTRGWSGNRIAWLAIIGFASVIFTYFGVNFVLSGLHSYGSS